MDQRKVLHRSFIAILLIAAFLGAQSAQAGVSAHAGRTRTYFVAADEVEWNYAPSGRDEAMGMPFDEIAKGYTQAGPHQIGSVCKKAIYREYTDATFRTLKPRPPQADYLGLVGPILHAEVGDTIKVVFKNKATHPYSMHPHGVLYAKDSEGAEYNDSTKGTDKSDGCVGPARPTRTSGAFPSAPAQARVTPAQCSGSTIRTAMSCATWPRACSADS